MRWRWSGRTPLSSRRHGSRSTRTGSMAGRNKQGMAMHPSLQSRFVRLLSVDRGSARRIAAAAYATLALGALGATLAYAAETQIFDSQTHKWVDYDRTKA